MANVVAVVYVVDASLALATEWGQIFGEYMLPLLQRLAELHSTPHFRVGVVSYGPAETRPTPLGKIFFGPPQVIFRDMREDPEKMGLGLSSLGDSAGLAALEGLVAAVELFDALKDSPEVTSSHIIHVAAAPPDGSEHPLWNMTAGLDDISWDTLPLELQKRKIHYSNILLRQLPLVTSNFTPISRQAAAGPSQQPWFAVRPHHVLHLTGFPTALQKGAKRSADGANVAGRAAELKRTKVESHPSPPQPPQPPPMDNVAPASPPQPVQTTPVNVAAPAPAPPSAQHRPAPQPPRPPHADIRMINPQVLHHMSVLVAKKKQEVSEHKQMGRAKEAAEGERDVQRLLVAFKQTQIQQMKNQALLAQSQSQPAALGNTGAPQPGSATDSMLTGTAGMPGSTSMPTMNNAASTSSSAMHADPLPVPDDHIGELGHQPSSNSEPMSSSQNPAPFTAHMPLQPPRQSDPNPPPMVNGPPHDVSQISPAMAKGQVPQPSGPSQGGGAPSLLRIWEGPAAWVDSKSGRMMQAHMFVNASDMLRAFPWPATLTLEPSTEFRVSMPKLQEWLKAHVSEYTMLFAAPNNTTNDPKQNEEQCMVIWRSVYLSHRYAIASLADPSGAHPAKRLLLFPVRPGQYAGAFFHGPRGIPELPPSIVGGMRVSLVPPSIAQLLLNLQPKEAAELEATAAHEKQAKITELVRQYSQRAQEQQRAQLLQQAPQNRQAPPQPQFQTQDNTQGDPTMATMGPSMMTQQQPPIQQRQPIAPNNLNTLIPMNPFMGGAPPTLDQMLRLGGGRPQAQRQMPNRMPSATPGSMDGQGMHQRVPSGGGGGTGNVNLSHEMMQSFMQRRQDGSGGMGGAMGGGMGL
ncbi:uncharacterized protein B0H18DRAFT_1008817 [Fomitopsis serialis]|uniref:uncharacterized protein n=1 Tax=Fomitopsis serialis TaxID=139415 RepID=UPI0020075513|nr:uncharacterized protein B0H18DRAFT_1008817 [Neoantrodia serialis]KAH9925523.1 hypothetical protein B0H18DRAFT_1008817 [Neoantrodia serialis]